MRRLNLSNTCLPFLALILAGCYGLRPSSGGGTGDISRHRKINPADIALPAGYSVEAIASDLTYPTGLTFDEQGTLYVIESGYSYGEKWTKPRLLRIDGDGMVTVVAEGSQNGPWNGVTFHEGYFYVAEGGVMEGGQILRIDKKGDVKVLVGGLPSFGDHHTNGPVVANGQLFFGQGTATNAAVVGEDNADFGWLKRRPEFHDIPCQDIVLNGVNYESGNPLQEGAGVVTTGAYVPFKTPTSKGQVIRGTVPCSGSILRVPLTGGEPQLVAWGFRNPFGLAVFQGKLFVVENGFDVRGSRPVWGTGDVLWRVEEGKWYGWPDYSGGEPLSSNEFRLPGGGTPQLLLQETPNTPPEPVAVLGVHSSSNGIAFPVSDRFGLAGQAFIAQFGDMSPNVGKVLGPVGFKVVAVDPATGVITDFAVNKGGSNGPASRLGSGGLERPVAVQFHPDGKSLYVADFGIVEIENGKIMSYKNSGVIWKITKETP